jgi:monoamine oxidase
LIDDLRLFAAQITHDAALLDEDWDTYAPQFDVLSVADYLELHADKIDKPYIVELFKDVIRSEYGAEAHESTALQMLFVLPVIEQESVDLISYSDEMYSVVGGSDQITDALGSNLEGQIQLRMELKEVWRTANKFHLTFANGTLAVADIVIVTIPFPALSAVNILASLPKLLRRFINEAKLGSNEKLLGSFKNRFWRQKKGFTGEAWSDLGFCVLWDATQRQSSRTDGALNFFLGGNQTCVSKNQSATDQGNQFLSRLNKILPGAASEATGKFLRSGWTKSRFTTGGYANYRPGQLTTFGDFFWVESDVPRERQEVSAGNLIFAGEHLSDAFYGFMNGGAQTGRLAANLTLKKIAAARRLG